MKVLSAILRELFGLFVEDGRYTVAILLWTALVAGAARRFGGEWRGPIFFAGLAVVLVSSVWQAASAKSRSSSGH